MFTGIIQDVGKVAALTPGGPGCWIAVETALDTTTFELGESVAVNGVCLTVTSCAAGRFEADVSPETLRRSNLGSLRPGIRVNLERALRPMDRLGGHFVLGHVDEAGRLVSVGREGPYAVYSFAASTRYLVEKGSVTVDGVSLTVASLRSGGFSVAAIPHTLERTTLPDRRSGDGVNLEFDILGKYVERLCGPGRGDGVTLDLLARSGFVK